MSETNGWLNRVRIVRVIALVAGLTVFLTGCAGYVDGGYGGGYGDYGGYDGYDGGESDIYLFGDGYGRAATPNIIAIEELRVVDLVTPVAADTVVTDTVVTEAGAMAEGDTAAVAVAMVEAEDGIEPHNS